MIFVFMVVATGPAYTYEKADHDRINTYISEFDVGGFSLDSYLRDYLGFKDGYKEVIGRLWWIDFSGYELYLGKPKDLSIVKCLSNGGRYEDNPSLRSAKHFHNPLLQWNQAGFKELGSSSILWAQCDNQSYGKYSWKDVRSYFYEALTASSPDEQAKNYVKTFEGLGRLMHLIQDSSVPSHTRDDGHLFRNFESYVKEIGDDGQPNSQEKYNGWLSDYSRYIYDESVLDLFPILDNPDILPIARIVDTDRYVGSNPDVTINQPTGLAEYSNANFFSRDTIFKTNKFPYPSRDSVGSSVDMPVPDPRDSSRTVSRQYFVKTCHGDTGYRLCTVPVYDEWMTMDSMLDNNVYDDYAQRLIPRAVSYSAGLLKYFFRGTIDIESFAVSDTGGEGGAQLIVSARNTSGGEDGLEEMSDGSIELAIHYWPADDKYQYLVLPEANGVGTIEREPTELVFDLGDNPPPIFAERCSFYLVYRGELGAEKDAVCVGHAANENKIALSLSEAGVYAQLLSEPDRPDSQGFDHIRILAQNVTDGGVEMPDGSIELVVQYRVSDYDPFTPQISYPDPFDNRVRYCTASTDIRSIPRDRPVEIDFDLGDSGVPLWAYDIYAYVVYRGALTLGNELIGEYSQAVGFRDISEPTPVTVVNHTDKVNLFGQWYDTGLDALDAVDGGSSGNGNGYGDEHTVFPRTFENVYVRFSPDDGIARYASPDPGRHNYCIPRIRAGRYVQSYVLSDYVFRLSGSSFSTQRTNPLDMMHVAYKQNLYTARGVKRQVEFNPDTGGTIFRIPSPREIRGVNFYGYPINYGLTKYPEQSLVSLTTLYSQMPDLRDEYADEE